MWLRYCAPVLGQMNVGAVTSAHILKIIDPMVARGHLPNANRYIKLLSAWWNWSALRFPAMPRNPTTGIELLPEEPLELSMSVEQMKVFGTAYTACQHPAKWSLLWLLLTGSRCGILQVLRPEWIEDGHVIFPKRTPGTKNARHVIMGSVALAMLQEHGCHVTDQKMREALDEVEALCGYRLTPHSLRKSYTSLAELELGVPRALIDQIVNHSMTKLHAAYYKQAVLTLAPFAATIEAGMLRLAGLQ